MELTDDHRRQRAEEFCELFAQVQRPLHRYVTALVVNANDVYDVLQETNLAMWESFDRFEPGTSFIAWARQIARNRVLAHFRHKNRNPCLLELEVWQRVAEAASEMSLELTAERERALVQCLAKLRDQDRTLVYVRYTSDATLAQSAQAVGRSENSLSQALRRIRNQLRSCIEQQLKLA